MAATKKNARKSKSPSSSDYPQEVRSAGSAPTESDLWQPLKNIAEHAFAFWHGFLDLRSNDDDLNDDQIKHFLMLIRAVSWVESRHSTGTGNSSPQDPMQCGNPGDAWWRELAGLSGNGDRFIGGPNAKNYWAKELPGAVEQDTNFPAEAKLSALGDIKQGHQDPAFGSTMSFSWAVPHLIWKTNVPSNRKAYQCDTVSRDELLDGAAAYNGGGDPDYRTKIDAALTLVGWPSATLDVASVTTSLRDVMLDRTTIVVEEAMRSIERRCELPKFFPDGINKIAISLKLGIEGEFSLTVEGPQHAGSPVDERRNWSGLDMENQEPPAPPPACPDDPHPATDSDVAILDVRTLKSIGGAASVFRQACAGGDRYKNNCAHFLSDAFIRAGYTELESLSQCIHVGCSTPAHRPIRAKDMRCWFKSMAMDTRTTLPKKEGIWAVFQFDERVYPGGHVVLIDTDSNAYYGTANYPNWLQYCYKW